MFIFAQENDHELTTVLQPPALHVLLTTPSPCLEPLSTFVLELMYAFMNGAGGSAAPATAGFRDYFGLNADAGFIQHALRVVCR